jgi:glycosyltransferase involved in cell wall biosynthesis
MKILQINYTASSGGIERLVIDLSNGLIDKGDITLCLTDDDRKESNSYYLSDIVSNVKYINLKTKPGLNPTTFFKIFSTIIKLKPDIVHFHTNAILAFLPSLIYQKPKYIHTIHNMPDKTTNKPYLKYIYKWFYKHKIQAVTISNLCQKSFIKYYGFDNAACIENGRSTLQITTENGIRKKEIIDLKGHDDDLVFIHVARCAEQKNQKLLIKTFNRLLKEGRHLILLILGDGFDHPKNQSLITDAQPGIHFLGSKTNVGDYLVHSDYFVLSSLWEGLPISLLEAISVGIVPISTPVGGVPDVINSAEIGFLSKSCEESDFYDVIIKAIENHGNICSQNLKNYFNKRFSMEECVNNYFSLFKKILDTPN